MVRQAPAQYRAVFAGVADDAVRRRPDAATWSMIEYACHVRDVFVVSVDRIQLARSRTATFAPLGNDDRAVRLRYERGRRRRHARGARRHRGAPRRPARHPRRRRLGRTASRLPGEERDVRWMARQAAHEGRHHLADITGWSAPA